MAIKGTAADRWKRKSWYDVLAPKVFNEKLVGVILATDKKQLIGRVVRTTIYDMTDDMRKSHMNVNLEIINIDSTNRARTRIKSFELARDYVRSLLRRYTTKVDAIITVRLSDDFVVKIKPFIVTATKCDSSQKHQIRRTVLEKAYIFARTQTLESLLVEVISDRLPNMLREHCKLIFPIKNVEVRMIEIVKHVDKELKDITTNIAPRRVKRTKQEIEAVSEARERTVKTLEAGPTREERVVENVVGAGEEPAATPVEAQAEPAEPVVESALAEPVAEPVPPKNEDTAAAAVAVASS